VQLREHQEQLDTFYRTQAVKGFWVDKYKPYLSIYRNRRYIRDAAIMGYVPEGAKRVLDIGCGYGDLMLPLAKANVEIIGIELSQVMLETARANLKEYTSVRFALAPAEALPFRDGSLDCVLLADVIEHLVDPQLCVTECNRVLRPGGRLIITTPNPPIEHFWQKVDGTVSAPFRMVRALRGKDNTLPPVLDEPPTLKQLRGWAIGGGMKLIVHDLIEFYPGSEGGGLFSRFLRLTARNKIVREKLIEPVFENTFKAIATLRIFNNRRLVVMQKPTSQNGLEPA
jgi:ubiquinone/menaquinone biosynthesis C-methylase UbiE